MKIKAYKAWCRDLSRISKKHRVFVSAVVIDPPPLKRSMVKLRTDGASYHSTCGTTEHGTICHIEHLTKVIHFLQHELQRLIEDEAYAKRKETS